MGGVLGPAHPFEYRRLGIANNPRWFNKLDIFKEFDFIEGFNSCCGEMGNLLAQALGKTYGLSSTSGSDAHKLECVGKARTLIDTTTKEINTTQDLIEAIKEKRITSATGEYHKSNLVRYRALFEASLYGFYLFNKLDSLRVKWRRDAEHARILQTFQ